ncbi:hypothetical protein CXB49_13445 [Chromobacterium sp. ATCC 53434]|uniref:DUF5610 domain-containing protein n=1 Tax=Chromobacterium TaxID=535 RepID=UPI000C773BCF|nr:DUF5610 domain-containing protein [Chromobacterium sp. ATCC 53434]AUH51752.1 hypothetical protein CXB49_13445 [Chromobacterium sp. ATCC 53434]
MSISSLNSNQAGQTGQTGASSQTQTGAYNAQTARNQLNATLVESLSVSISSGKQSQSLLFQASITHINQILNADFSNQDGSQQGQSGTSVQISSTQLSITVQQQDSQSGSDDDTSPQATSQRILQGALGMFGLYQQQHPEQSTSDQAQNFIKLIRQGFEQGYQEATDVLKKLNVFNGDVSDGVQQTHDLVEKGLDAFLQQYQGSSTQQAASGAAQDSGS